MSELEYLVSLDGGREGLALAVIFGSDLLDIAWPGWEEYAALPDENKPSGCLLSYLWGYPGIDITLWPDDEDPHYAIPRLVGREYLDPCHEWGFAVPPGMPKKSTWRRLVRLWQGLLEYRERKEAREWM